MYRLKGKIRLSHPINKKAHAIESEDHRFHHGQVIYFKGYDTSITQIGDYYIFSDGENNELQQSLEKFEFNWLEQGESDEQT